MSFKLICNLNIDTDLSFVVDLLAFSSMHTACTIIMHVQICLGLCRPHSSLGTWLVFAMASFLCLGRLVSEPLCYLSDIYTNRSSVSSGLVLFGLLTLSWRKMIEILTKTYTHMLGVKCRVLRVNHVAILFQYFCSCIV